MRSRSSRLCSALAGSKRSRPGDIRSAGLPLPRAQSALVRLGLVAPARFASQIDAQVHRDAVQPGIEVRLPLKQVGWRYALERFLADVGASSGSRTKPGPRGTPVADNVDQHPELRPVAAADSLDQPPLPWRNGPARHARARSACRSSTAGVGSGLLQSMFAMSRLPSGVRLLDRDGRSL